jgi:hypothetical protein
MRHGTWRKRPQNEHQKAIQNTQRVVNAMIRERDAGLPCISCGKMNRLYAGHFRVSTLGRTRFHPTNLNGQCNDCNAYNGGRTYEYAIALDLKFGSGWAEFLYKLSQKIEPWETEELEQLRSAARMGPRAYQQLYFELRPTHFFRV